MGVPKNGGFIRENPMRMDDLEATPTLGNHQLMILGIVLNSFGNF